MSIRQYKIWVLGIVLFVIQLDLQAQIPSNFFLDTWEPRILTSPVYNDITQTDKVVNVSVNIHYEDTVTKVSKYLFGDNVNTYTTSMSENKSLMKHLAGRDMGVLRGPGGSISDVYFWNRYSNNRPTDIPLKQAGSTEDFGVWYGKKFGWESWSMGVDSFYSVLRQVKATGMITVNYGYARYGTSANPVATAAHLAADWVRYDKGRTKFWEIGNESFGSWETGYRIDKTLNKDNQPEYLNSTIYGQHCLVFIDSMKKAAAEIGVNIKVGVVAAESSQYSTWNEPLFALVGDKADFYSVHSYFTSNTTATSVLNSYTQTAAIKAYVWNGLQRKSKPQKPIALTEYNIGSGNGIMVSHINGLHGALVVGEAMRTGYGAATRWAVANGGGDGNDHGMFSYGDSSIPNMTPRPAFYSMYFFRKYFGDVMVRNTVLGSQDIIVFASKFNSGQAAAALINKGTINRTVRINITNFSFGDRYYTYTLTGGTDNGSFSRKTFVNGNGPTGTAGGPSNYATIKANSSLIDNEIKIEVPAMSMVVFIADKGDKTLPINNQITGIDARYRNGNGVNVNIFPMPVKDQLNLVITGAEFQKFEIRSVSGIKVYSSSGKYTGSFSLPVNLQTGIYMVKLEGKDNVYSTKIIVE